MFPPNNVNLVTISDRLQQVYQCGQSVSEFSIVSIEFSKFIDNMDSMFINNTVYIKEIKTAGNTSQHSVTTCCSCVD